MSKQCILSADTPLCQLTCSLTSLMCLISFCLMIPWPNITENWSTTERETGGCYPQLRLGYIRPMKHPQKQRGTQRGRQHWAQNIENTNPATSSYTDKHTHTSAAAYTSFHTYTYTAAVSFVCHSLVAVLGWRMIYRDWQWLCGVGKSTESAVLTDPIHPSKC